MWERACGRLEGSVHAVITKSLCEHEGISVPCWYTIGTAFAISLEPIPTFLTNAHVVTDDDGIVREDLALVLFPPPGKGIADASVRILEKELDVAVLEGCEEAKRVKPVTFSGNAVEPMGVPVASLGFPIPDLPTTTASGEGSLRLNRRLATGFLSNVNHFEQFPDFPWARSDLPHYELNMLAYGGISGGPLFNLDGIVVGMNRGSASVGGQVVAYSFALRNMEVCELLDAKGVSYERV